MTYIKPVMRIALVTFTIALISYVDAWAQDSEQCVILYDDGTLQLEAWGPCDNATKAQTGQVVDEPYVLAKPKLHIGNTIEEIVEELCIRRLEYRVGEKRNSGLITFSAGQVNSVGNNFYVYAGEYHKNEGRRTTHALFPCRAKLVGSNPQDVGHWRVGVKLSGTRF